MMYQTDTMADSTTTAALAINGAQPAWMTLNEAREHAFTGEIVFQTDPEVHAYLDNGIVYYAERATDVALGRRLLDAGVLDMIQLERGTVRVGDIEHLGRLFDRDPSVDRDAVTVLAETATEELITELANRAITTVRATAYRHHPSGVHRWFVAPLDPAAVPRPFGVVAQLDTTVVGQLPGLPFGSGVDELTIEWDDQTIEWDHQTNEPNEDVRTADVHMSTVAEFATDEVVDYAADVELSTFEDLTETFDTFDAVDTLDTLDVDVDEDLEVDIVDGPEVVMVVMVDMVNTVEETVELEFTVVWPDGSEEPESTDEGHQAYEVDADPAFTQTDDGNIQFIMPPLTLSDEPELADADVPEPVADAVRRAIAAVESASFSPPVPYADTTLRAEITAQLPQIVDIDTADRDVLDDTVIRPIAPVVVTPGGFGGFAPPTLATSAHVLYGQQPTDGASVGVATLEADIDHQGDRSSALRRLIGSLRRKDH